MDFQRIKTVAKPEFYLDMAEDRADKRTREFRETIGKGVAPLEKSKGIEMYRLQIYAENLRSGIAKVLYSFPKQEHFSPFYESLLTLQLDINRYYDSLDDIWHLTEKIKQLYRLTFKRMKHSETPQAVTRHRKEFEGRVKKIVQRMGKSLEYLRHARGILRQLPVIKAMPTIVIAGFPNVGKSSLLGAITGSQPLVASWPFTTQQIMLGYRDHVQVVDTPGLLDRMPEQRNEIEQQAALALEHLADLLLFVFDPTETCGYTMEQQERLRDSLTQMIDVTVVEVYNKSDLREEKQPAGSVLKVSANDAQSIESLWSHLMNVLPEYEQPDENAEQSDPEDI